MPTLTQKIQKAIPALMKLREGCMVTFKDKHYPLTLFAIKDNYFRFYDEKKTTYAWSKEEALTVFKIIGHEPQLNHVLKYLEMKDVYFIIEKDTLYERASDFLKNENGIKLNLESNLLKDQPKPLLEWLDKIE